MFFSPGFTPNEIGDFEVVEHEGRLHAFYLALPSHDAIGHLVSDDGINWEQLPFAIRTGDPGEFDGDQIWTMGVFKNDDHWIMLYTSNQRNGLYQVVGLARSDDLMTWTKHDKNPVAAPDPRWYEAEQTGNYRVDWRDPHIIKHNGVYHAFLCARQNKGLLNHRGCAGYFTSKDGYNWEVQPPASTPNNCWDYECPSVFELNGRFYMVTIHGAHDRATYRVADRVEGPYRRLHDDSLTPYRNMSVRPCMFRGKMHLFHWDRGLVDWDWYLGSYTCLSSPKIASADADGNLTVSSFDWSANYDGPTTDITPQTSGGPGGELCGDWQWNGDQLQGHSEFGHANWLTDETYTDFELTADVDLGSATGACEFGFVIRADETGDQAITTRAIPGRGATELVKQIYNRKEGPDSMWRGRSVVQPFHFTPTADGKYRMRVIAFGPSIEFNLNDRLCLSHLTMPRRSGKVGVFLEDGRATFSNIRITPIHKPRTHWCNATKNPDSDWV